MDFLAIAAAAFLASGLTLYSGFGLGTVLLPVFALFLPTPVAVAATGVVHLLNNLFKGTLLWRRVDWGMVVRFGVPAIPAAILGAWLLGALGDTPRLFIWAASGRVFGPTAAGVAVGGLLIGFALLELSPWFQRLAAPPRLIPAGGVITGFLGGLTGQQGALRAMFLLKSGMAPPRFIATGVAIAVLIDLARLPTYAVGFAAAGAGIDGHGWALVGAGTTAAFAGAWIGVRHLDKVTIGAVRGIVAALMLGSGVALAAGVIG